MGNTLFAAQKRFWMVYVQGGRGPECQHPTLESAQLEAVRLSRQALKPAWVLEAVGGVWTEVEVTPFRMEKDA